MKPSISDRWIHYVGRQAVKSPHAYRLTLLAAIILLTFGGMILVTSYHEFVQTQVAHQASQQAGSTEEALRYAGAVQYTSQLMNTGFQITFLGLAMVGASLMAFERARFYRLIQDQAARIEELQIRRDTGTIRHSTDVS